MLPHPQKQASFQLFRCQISDDIYRLLFILTKFNYLLERSLYVKMNAWM